jgi:hypothetical protein
MKQGVAETEQDMHALDQTGEFLPVVLERGAEGSQTHDADDHGCYQEPKGCYFPSVLY